MISFTVPGTPVAKGRAKVTTINGFARMYTPAKTVSYESTVALFASQAMAGRKPLDGPVSLSVHAVFAIPASWTKKRLRAHLDNPEYVIKKPDFDNLIKALCDGMNGVVWVDDCQVAALGYCSKVYGDQPRVDVTVGVLDPFFGSGTTGQVAQQLGRQYIGCELNPAYKSLQDERTCQQSLLLEAA